MENYIVDYVRAYRNIHVISMRSDEIGEAFEHLSEFNIETCVYSEGLEETTIIIHRLNLCGLNDSNEVLRDSLSSLGFNILEGFTLIDVGGLFIGGGGGLSHAILDALTQSKVNIEYQIFGSNRFSFLIKDNVLNKALKNITYLGKVRDSKITVFD